MHGSISAPAQPVLPAQPVQLNVYPVKSLLHLFLWGALLKIRFLFNRDEIVVSLISSGCPNFILIAFCRFYRWEISAGNPEIRDTWEP